MRSSTSWWASRARQFRAHLRARVAPEERAALATWITPAQLALFDSMHVADRRHGLDVVASLRAERVTNPTSCSPGCSTTPARATRASGRGSPTRSASRYGAWIWRVAAVVPGLRPRARAAPDACRDLGRARRRGRLPATDRRADPLPGRADRSRIRRAAAARGRGQLMSTAGSPGVPVMAADGAGPTPVAPPSRSVTAGGRRAAPRSRSPSSTGRWPSCCR